MTCVLDDWTAPTLEAYPILPLSWVNQASGLVIGDTEQPRLFHGSILQCDFRMAEVCIPSLATYSARIHVKGTLLYSVYGHDLTIPWCLDLAFCTLYPVSAHNYDLSIDTEINKSRDTIEHGNGPGLHTSIFYDIHFVPSFLGRHSVPPFTRLLL